MPMFGGRGYSPRVSHPNYAGGLAQLGQTIGQGIQRGQQDAKFKRWNEGVQAVKEDSGGDENKILEALWRGSEIGDDPRVQAVMQNLIPQYQGVLDQRAAAEAAAEADAQRGSFFAEADALWEAGDKDGARQFMIRQGFKPAEVDAAFPAEEDTRTTAQRDFEYAQNQGYQGSFEDWKASGRPTTNITLPGGDAVRPASLTYDPASGMEPEKGFSFNWVDPTDPTKGLVKDEQGRPRQMPLPGTEKPATESEVKLDNVIASGARAIETLTPEMLQSQTGFFNHLVSKMPGFGNYLVSDDFQIGRVAMSRFTESLLRQASGAATPDYEVERYRQDYSPIPGDQPETIRWKLEQLVEKVQSAQQKNGQDVTAKLPEQWSSLWGEDAKAKPPEGMQDNEDDARTQPNAPSSPASGAGDLTPEEQRELEELRLALAR